jgi:hypothetical protein
VATSGSALARWDARTGELLASIGEFVVCVKDVRASRFGAVSVIVGFGSMTACWFDLNLLRKDGPVSHLLQ